MKLSSMEVVLRSNCPEIVTLELRERGLYVPHDGLLTKLLSSLEADQLHSVFFGSVPLDTASGLTVYFDEYDRRVGPATSATSNFCVLFAMQSRDGKINAVVDRRAMLGED